MRFSFVWSNFFFLYFSDDYLKDGDEVGKRVGGRGGDGERNCRRLVSGCLATAGCGLA